MIHPLFLALGILLSSGDHPPSLDALLRLLELLGQAIGESLLAEVVLDVGVNLGRVVLSLDGRESGVGVGEKLGDA